MTTAPAANSSPAVVRTPATRPSPADEQILGPVRDDGQSVLGGQKVLDRLPVEPAVRLRARAPHRGTLAAVEDAELDPGAVDGAGHQSVEGVDLPHQMALGETADRRIARHLADRIATMGQQQRARAHARRRGGRLAACMAAADDDDVETFLRIRHGAALYGSAALPPSKSAARGHRCFT
jgi:hypothetical protein